jgi:hypothetical protein
MLVCRGGVLMRVAAMFMRRRRVFFGLSMPPMFVIVCGFAVMMGSTFVMRRCLMMMFAGGMFCFCHDVSSLVFICPLKGALSTWGRAASDSTCDLYRNALFASAI